MEIKELKIPDVKLITLSPNIDERGYFLRNYDIEIAKKYSFHKKWVQENISLSKKKGTLRGLHFQLPGFSETKLISVIMGSVFDVFVDLRNDSQTFGKWGSIILSSDNPQLIFLPKGIAHGFITLENNTLMTYKLDSFFEAKAYSQIKWNDPEIKIKWPLEPKVISQKDNNAQSLREFINTIGGL